MPPACRVTLDTSGALDFGGHLWSQVTNSLKLTGARKVGRKNNYYINRVSQRMRWNAARIQQRAGSRDQGMLGKTMSQYTGQIMAVNRRPQYPGWASRTSFLKRNSKFAPKKCFIGQLGLGLAFGPIHSIQGWGREVSHWFGLALILDPMNSTHG